MPTASTTPIADAVESITTPGAAPTAFDREQAGLRRQGPPDLTRALGAPLPDAVLLSPTGAPVTIDDARHGTAAVIVLYRGAWCPFCNIALRNYQEHLLPGLRRRGVTLVALSPQKPDGSLSMTEKNALDYAVLSDPANQIAAGLGVLTSPTEDARALQLEHGLDVAAQNIDNTTQVPMPTVVIIDRIGNIRWIDVHPDYTTRTEPDEVLAALDALDALEL
jgi:peroxiredoxin